jgi:hypothetical protein
LDFIYTAEALMAASLALEDDTETDRCFYSKDKKQLTLTLGVAANNTCEYHMYYMHVVPIQKKGYKAAFTRLRVTLLHALFSSAGE